MHRSPLDPFALLRHCCRGFSATNGPTMAKGRAPTNQAGLPEPDFLPAVGWTVLLICIMAFSAAFLVIPLSYILKFEEDSFWQAAIAIPTGQIAVLLFAIYVVRSQYGLHWRRCLAWRLPTAKQFVLVLMFSLPVAILSSEVCVLMRELFVSMEIPSPSWLKEFLTLPLPLVLVFLCLLPAIGEELFFRGFLSRGLIGQHGIFVGTFMATLMFAVMHLNPIQVVYTLVIGLAAQIVYLSCRSIAAPMMLHVANNGIAIAFLEVKTFFQVPGLSDYLSDEPVRHVPALVIVAAAFATLAIAAAIVQSRTQFVDTKGKTWDPGYVTAELPPAFVSARPTSMSAGVGILMAAAGTFAFLVFAMVQSSLPGTS
jgi:membrane protease YdiL (CAAX protease family)